MTWARLRYGFSMLSVILLAVEPAEAALTRERIVRSLASLVPACVQGLVADALIIGPPGMGLSHVADEAGCAHMEAQDATGACPAAYQSVRQHDVFLLHAGYAIGQGFIDEVRDRLSMEAMRALALRAGSSGLLTRIAPNLAPVVGVVARREVLIETKSCDFSALARRLRCAELETRARKAR